MKHHILFKLKQTEKEKELSKILGYPVASKVIILQDTEHVMNEEVGHIFTPSGSGSYIVNAIQVCGFSEAFDLWGCGIYKGYKDIQLLFDKGSMGGESHFDLDKCCRCYKYPCQCDNKYNGKKEIENQKAIHKLPFNVKRSGEIEERLQKKEEEK